MILNLDPDAASPLYEQLKDQVRYAVSIGELGPGDPLPSIRQIESDHGIHRNTVRRAYLDLAAEGLIRMRRGRRAEITEAGLPRPARGTAHDPTASERLAEETLRHAVVSGLDVLRVADRFTALALAHDARAPRLAFVECDGEQARAFSAIVARLAQRHVAPLVLGDLVDDDAPPLPTTLELVMVPPWHLAATRAALETDDRAVVGIRVQVSDACCRTIRDLGSAPLGLVVRDAESVPGYAERLRQHAGVRDVRGAILEDAPAVESILHGVRHVVTTTPCLATVRARAPREVTVIELEHEPVAADVVAALTDHDLPPRAALPGAANPTPFVPEDAP